jgi:predicted transposase YdaD
MRQDKDRSGKWLITHHGDSILALAGITGFSHWKALQPETVAPRRLPDGLIEVRFPGEAESILVLVEIETYPDREADQQVLDDLMLLALDRKLVPEVVSIVLKEKGNLSVTGTVERTSPRGRTRVGGSWPVVRLWELEAEQLLATGDVGQIPWVPLTRTTQSPETLLRRCRDQLAQVKDAKDRAGLLTVTQILAGLAFPDRRFLDLFGGARTMIESPVLDEVKEILRKQFEAEATLLATRRTLQQAVLEALDTRFGTISEDLCARVNAVTDEASLRGLHRLAISCPDVEAFAVSVLTK